MNNKIIAYLCVIKEKIKKPTLLTLVIFCMLSVVFLGVTIAFTLLGYDKRLVYIFLTLGAVSLGYFIYTIVYCYPLIKSKFISFASKNKYTKKYVEDYRLRGIISASISFCINTIYAIVQGVLALLSHSIWYGALGAYYLVLSAIRGGIIFKYYTRRTIESEQEYLLRQAKSYRNCGIYLNILTIALSGAIIQMVILNQGYEYAGLMIYVMALYAFYKITVAIVNFVHAKDLTVLSIRNLNLSDALVSILALQTAMFQAFGGNANPHTFNALTGAGIVLMMIVMSIIMILKGNKKIKEYKGDANE